MLKDISIKYFLICMIFYLFFAATVERESATVYVLNIFFAVSFITILEYARKKTDSFYRSKHLIFLVSIYGLIGISTYNLVSFYYNDNFFSFNEIDALLYHNAAEYIADTSFQEGVGRFLKDYDFDDLGIVIVIGTLYQIAQSNLILNIFYLLISIFSAVKLFELASYFMSKMSAFICSLAFYSLSFVVWFNSSGLKESLLIFLVIYFFERYYRFALKKDVKALPIAFLAVAFMLFFRPAVGFFCVFSVGLTFLIFRWKSVVGLITIIASIIFIIILSSILIDNFNRYLMGGDLTYLLQIKEQQGMVIGGIGFTYAVNILAQAIGPMATFTPGKSEILSFYAPGLVYRILIGVPFWLGIGYIFKKKVTDLFPIAFFVLMEMLSLTLILEGLELRKAIPHFSLVFVIGFFYLDKFDTKIISKRRTFLTYSTHLAFLLILGLLFFWNTRLA